MSLQRFILSLFLLSCAAGLQAQAHAYWQWRSLALPPDSAQVAPPGLAGVYAGIDGNVLLMAGGAHFSSSSRQDYRDAVFALAPGEKGDTIWQEAGKLPVPVAYGTAIPTRYGLWCLGGMNESGCLAESWFLRYDPLTAEIGIRPGPSLPFPLAQVAAAVVGDRLYLAGGVESPEGPATRHFFSLDLRPDSSQWTWESLPAWPGGPRALAVAAAQSDGREACFYLFSGRDFGPDRPLTAWDDGFVYRPGSGNWERLAGARLAFPAMAGTAFALGSSHIVLAAGREAWVFHTITKGLWQARFDLGSERLSNLDYGVIALYFLVLAGMGYYFAGKQRDTRDYFKGGERIPWWAAGLSIFGTGLSAITFMAIPAKAYATDWAYYLLGLTILGVAPVIARFFVPFYRKLNITSAYEYLEMRFNLAVRILGSLSFMLFQVGRMGIVLYLPALALHVVSGVDIFLSIGLMAAVSLAYTLAGGIEAVIWTDVMQVFVLMGGALLSLFLMIVAIEGGMSTIVEAGMEDAKFGIVNLNLSLREPTLWVVVLGGMFINLTTYGTDQTIVQRYLTTRDVVTAQRTVWTNGWLSLISTTLFFFLGTALYVFYRQFPAQLNPTLPNHDAIFPWYIISQLPPGISGLLIAGIFAAAMSSLSSSMNSVAAAYSIDIHRRFGLRTRRSELGVARRATLVAGLAGTLFALLMATADIQSLWDEFQKVLGLILGSLGGVFLLGMMSRRANGRGALAGIVLSTGVQYLVALYQPVHLLLYSATGVISCFVLGWLASFLFPAQDPSIPHSPT